MKKNETLNFRVPAAFKRKLIEEANKQRRSLTNYRLARYGSSLERSFFRLLHELERRQASRSGAAVPLPTAMNVDLTIHREGSSRAQGSNRLQIGHGALPASARSAAESPAAKPAESAVSSVTTAAAAGAATSPRTPAAPRPADRRESAPDGPPETEELLGDKSDNQENREE